MAIWVGKQKMSCRSCIKGHRSSTCNHLGGPLWAVRPAGRPNKACIHGPGDLCLCAHYFPLTWLKAAVPRNKKCSCQGEGGSGRKCNCGHSNGAGASTPDTEETQPIYFQDLVARGLQVTTEPVDIDMPVQTPTPAPTQPPSSCCSVPATAPPAPVQASCCSVPPAIPAVPVSPPPPSSCCSHTVKSEPVTPALFGKGHIKPEPFSVPPFATPAPTPAPVPPPHFLPSPDFKAIAFRAAQAAHTNDGDHACHCGPTCNCVLCIDHPYNTATMNHIATEFGQMMTDGSNGASFSPPNGTTNGGPAMFAHGWPPANNGAIPHGMMPAAFDDPVMSRQSPPQQATDIFLNPADFQMFNFAFPPMDNMDQFGTQADFSYGTVPELDMGGMCGGIPEGCPCGDDCACIGCQVHGKPHNAVPAPSWS